VSRSGRPYDMVVIGGGTGGLVAAVGAAGVGARVTLVEEDRTGGDCLWTGCVPSKALIAAARRAHDMRTADRVGLTPVEPEVDLARVMSRVHATQHAIAPHDSPERLEREGVEVIAARGRLAGPGRVELSTGRTLVTRTAVLATGSRPVLPPVAGLADADPLTSDTLWDLTELPGRLVVLGGGPIGCELGQSFARLGSRVTIVEMLDRLLTREEPEAGAVVHASLVADGIDVRVATRAERVETDPDGGRVLVVSRAGVEDRVPFDRILVAAGRRPSTDDLGLATAGVRTTERGHVVVDDTLRTTAPWVWAAGDVTGGLPFTHVAGKHGGIVVTNALFKLRRRVSYDTVPWATFTDPEVGRVGLTEAEARERYGDAVTVTTSSYAGLDRAIANATPDGFAKLVAGPRDRIVGATIVGEHGGDAIAEIVAWMSKDEKLGAVGQTTHAYPTYTEASAKAANEVLRERFFSPRVRAVTRPVLALLRLLDRPGR
jgi:pyruvate/2-oxoglutarate dehydrogenase complex dihydrolipoamide dehydrogenase (E3) component